MERRLNRVLSYLIPQTIPIFFITTKIRLRSWVEGSPQLAGSSTAVGRKCSPQWAGAFSAVEWKLDRSGLEINHTQIAHSLGLADP